MKYFRMHVLREEIDPATGGDPGAGAPASNPPPADQGTGTPSDSQPPVNYFDMKSLPNEWRKQLAGEDAEALKYLERVPDMGTLVKNYVSAQNKIRSGELSSGLPANANEQQLAEWRAANGVPEAPDRYELNLAQGLVLGDDDKQVLETVFQAAHQHNIPTAAMSEITNAFLKSRELEVQAMQNQDGLDSQMTTRQLRETWGPDYDTNLNLVRGLMSKLPDSVREDFMGGRLADGRALLNSPEVMVFLSDIMRQVDPIGAVIPNSGNPMGDLKTEIKALEKQMRDDIKAWHNDKGAQKRLMELYEAEERLAGAAR